MSRTTIEIFRIEDQPKHENFVLAFASEISEWGLYRFDPESGKWFNGQGGDAPEDLICWFEQPQIDAPSFAP